VDSKANLLPNQQALAVAPRLRLGFAAPSDSTVWLVETGVLASHRWLGVLEPYAGLAFANHWLDYPMERPDLAPNQQLAERQGTGDGLLKGHLGLDLTVIGGLGTTAEYGYWKTLNNDPGDGYKFVDNHVLALSLRYQGGHSATSQGAARAASYR
jgi:hypothetical protein